MFKKLLLAVAAFAATVMVATPVMACDEDCQKLAIGVGAFLYGRATAPQQRAVPPYGGYGQPQYGGYGRQAPPQVIVIERQPQIVVVREAAPTIVRVADPKTPGTPCVSRTYGWVGVWTTLPRNDIPRMVCQKS